MRRSPRSSIFAACSDLICSACRQRLADLLELATQVVELGVEQRDLGLCIGAQPALFGDCPVTLIDQRRQRLDTDLALLQLALYEQRVLGLQRQFRLQALLRSRSAPISVTLLSSSAASLPTSDSSCAGATGAGCPRPPAGSRSAAVARGSRPVAPGCCLSAPSSVVAQCALVAEQAVDARRVGDLAAEPLAVLLFQAKQVRQFDHALVHHVQLGLLLVEQL